MGRIVDATFRIVTPMFLGGADPRAKPDSIRPPSVKGALRFWWRACQWPALLVEFEDRPHDALRALHEREARLFGSAASSREKSGQARFLMDVDQPKRVDARDRWPVDPQSGSGYMAFGILPLGEMPHRFGIEDGGSFSVRLRSRSDVTDVELQSLRAALRTWGTFGGLGSRARRGFGSIALSRIDGDDVAMTRSQYEAEAATLLARGDSAEGLPPYTAFSRHARFGVLCEDDDARTAHDTAGRRFNAYRGMNGKVRGQAKRAFGLPLQKIDEDNRRASPLLFHVHPLRGSRFVAAVLSLPARFHPEIPEGDRPSFFDDVQRFVPGAPRP